MIGSPEQTRENFAIVLSMFANKSFGSRTFTSYPPDQEPLIPLPARLNHKI